LQQQGLKLKKGI